VQNTGIVSLDPAASVADCRIMTGANQPTIASEAKPQKTACRPHGSLVNEKDTYTRSIGVHYRW